MSWSTKEKTLELFRFTFVEVIKKFMGSVFFFVFFWVGVTLYVEYKKQNEESRNVKVKNIK